MITSALSGNKEQIDKMVNGYVGEAVGRGMADNMWENNVDGLKDEIESLVERGELELKEGEEPKDLLGKFCGGMMSSVFKEAADSMNTAKIFEDEDKDKAGMFR